MGRQRRRGRQHGGQSHDHRVDDQLRGLQKDRLCREHRRQPGLYDRNADCRRQHFHALQPHPALAEGRAPGPRYRSGPFCAQGREIGHDHQFAVEHGGGYSAQGKAYQPVDRRRYLHLRDAHRLRTADPQRSADPDQRGLCQCHGRQPYGEMRVARARHRGRAHLPLHQHDVPLPPRRQPSALWLGQTLGYRRPRVVPAFRVGGQPERRRRFLRLYRPLPVAPRFEIGLRRAGR